MIEVYKGYSIEVVADGSRGYLARIYLGDTLLTTALNHPEKIGAMDSARGYIDSLNTSAFVGLPAGPEASPRTPLKISSSAPANAVYVDSVGNMGLKTASPAQNLHLRESSSGAASAHCRIRFEHLNIGGVGATQTYEAGTNWSSANWEVVNSNSGATPFRIQPGAVTNTVFLASTGVGILTGAPNILGALDVNGAIYQRGGLLHADHVFENAATGKQPEPFGERFARIVQDRHLPEVGPRRTVVMLNKDGSPQIGEDGNPVELELIEVGSRIRAVLIELENAYLYMNQLFGRISDAENKISEQANEIAAIRANDGKPEPPTNDGGA